VDVIEHQAIGPYGHVVFAHLFGEQIAIDALIDVFEEDRLAAIAARRHVMRMSGNHDARQACHRPPFITSGTSGEQCFLSP
jgi:hypothetical protein